MEEKYYKALTIAERIDVLKKSGFELKTDRVFLDRWTDIKGLSSIVDTKKLCEYNGFTMDEFTYAIKPFDSIEEKVLEDATHECDWYKIFKKVMEVFKSDEVTFEELNETISYVIRPFIKYFLLLISDFINKNEVKVTQECVSGIIDWVAMSLVNIPAKIVTLDLHTSKETNPDISFKDYLTKYSSAGDLEAFYSKYPVMARLLTEKTIMSIENVNGILKALIDNEEEVIALSGSEQVIIDKILFGEGDTHSRGKSVSTIHFKDGKKIIYKPKCLKIEKYFNEFIDFINENKTEDLLELKTCNSIWRDEYTFCEFVESLPCKNKEEVSDYYERVGEILLLMYIFNGTDFHYENIIASKGYPYLIDIETLFQVANYDIIPQDDKAEIVIAKNSVKSVLSVGILPLLGFNQNSEGKSIDISALNGKEQKLPFKVLQMKNANTPDMIYEYDYTEISGAGNIPYIGEERQMFADYSDSFIKGFQKMSEFVLANKEKIRDKVNELFRKDFLYVRQLTKATANYATLMSYSNHPNYLSDMMYMERLYENLMAYPYSDKRIVSAEIKDMLSGDIPIFFSQLCSRDIYTSDFEAISHYFSKSPLDRAILKIEMINSDVIKEQMNLLLSSIGEKKKKRIKWINDISKRNEKNQKLNVNSAKKVAIKLTEKLLDMRVFNEKGDDFSWMKYTDSIMQIEPVDYSYANGLSGIGRYFDAMYQETNKSEYASVRDFVLEKIDAIPLKIYDKNPDNMKGIISFINSKFASKYVEYLIGLGRRIIDGSVKLRTNHLLDYIVLAKEYFNKTQSEDLNEVLNYVREKNEDVLIKLTANEILYCGDIRNDEDVNKLREYGDKILSVSPYLQWSTYRYDAYSNGMMEVVNDLIDLYTILGEEKYLSYAQEVMGIIYQVYIEYGDFRIMSDMDDCNASLFNGIAGIAYTFERAYVNENLPDIFCLKA